MNNKCRHKSAHLCYQPIITEQDIDIARLRPGKSYDNLIENRTHPLKELMREGGVIDPDALMRRDCPNCHSGKYSPLFEKDYFDIVKCTECELVFVNPILKPEICERIYRSKEYAGIVKNLGEESHNYRKQRFGRERIDHIEEYTQTGLPRRLLEIGCSTGFLLEAAMERGWEAVGLELNESAVGFGRKRGLNIINKPLNSVDFASERFSAVALYDVLEHLVDPGAIIDQLSGLLLEGGSIFIYVPNFQSASKELMGIENSHFIWPTHHLTYFTPLTLVDFLTRRGFDLLHWETQGLDIEDWLWFLNNKQEADTTILNEYKNAFQFYINASGHGKNLRLFARKGNHA